MVTEILVATLLTARVVAPQDYHDTLEKEIVIEDLSSSELKDFLYCLLDKQPCTDVFAAYKKHNPYVFKEECSRCSKCQKHMLYVFLNRISVEFPEEYKEYCNKYDPTNEHIPNMYKKIMAEKDKSYC